MRRCRWLAIEPLCDKPSTGWAQHPIYGAVPACDEHRTIAARALEETTVPVRPPCTCPGISDELTCPRHGERARLAQQHAPQINLYWMRGES